MGFEAVSAQTAFDFKHEGATFRLSPLTKRRYTQIVDRMPSLLDEKGDEDPNKNGNRMNMVLDTVEMCLAGWSGVTDKGGNEIAFPGSSTALEMLPWNVLMAICNRLINGSNLSEDDVKNSPSPQD